MGLFDKGKKTKIFVGGKRLLTCPCNDCDPCAEDAENNPGPPANCGWLYTYEYYVDSILEVTNSFGMPGLLTQNVTLPDINQGTQGEVVIIVQPLVSVVPAGILFNAFNFTGTYNNPVDNSPATVAVGTPFTIGSAELDTSTPGNFTVGLKAESQCGDLEVVFEYNVV